MRELRAVLEYAVRGRTSGLVTGGNRAAAATELVIGRATLYARIRSYRIAYAVPPPGEGGKAAPL